MVKVKQDLTGIKFGRLTVLEQAEDYVSPKGCHKAAWLVQCDCNSDPFVVQQGQLKDGSYISCGCSKLKLKKDLTNKKFGRLTVLRRAENYVYKDGTHQTQWYVICDCGKTSEFITSGYSLTSGRTKSCGCYKIEQSKLNKKYNDYNLNGQYGIGYAKNGEEFYFDLSDYDLIKDYYWNYDPKGYVCSCDLKNINNGNKVMLHRLVMNAKSGDKIDHIKHLPRNEKKRDNRKSNLRFATTSQNGMNQGLNSNNTSGVTGVSWNKRSQKWKVDICVNNKRIYLGYYSTFEEAVKIRKQAEEKYFGEWSYDNSQSKSN